METEHVLEILPQEYYLRNAYIELLERVYKLDDMWQGYLLVTTETKSYYQ